MRNTMVSMLSLLLVFSMVFSLIPAAFATETMEVLPQNETVDIWEESVSNESLDAAAVTGPHMAAAGMKILSKETTQVAPGVSYEQIISRNSSDQQNIGYLTRVDLTQKVTLKAGYKGYYTAGSTAAQRAENYKTMGWGFQPVRQMASDYAAIADPAGTVVMATNCDFFNMTTGEPSGYLVMEGNLIHTTRDGASPEPYFAILKDGTAVIRDAGADTSDVVEAISGPYYIIKDGQNVGSKSDTVFPGNSIGLCDDGSVLFYLNDGRQAPISAGMSAYDLAAVLMDAGCHTALYLDGGGSATLAARKQGASSLEVVNSPSDGYERGVSSALLFVSTASATGKFDHAVITPADKSFASNAKVQFAAAGVDTAGFAVDVPGDVSWVLSDSSFGTIDAKGLFTAGTKTGKVAVELRQGSKLVGSTQVEISGTVEHALDNAVYDRVSCKVICNSCGAELDPVEEEYTDWARDKETGKRMYLLNGKVQTGEFLFGSDTYYFDKNGVGFDGEETIDGINATFENGLMVGGHTGFITKEDGKTYHYDNGKMTRGWLFLGDNLYHFDPDSGVMTTGKKVQPDEETVSKDVYYDFADDGKALYGYPNGFGYYYWGGLPHANAWVKNGNTIKEDPDAWYRTNSNGHFVTDGSGKEVFDLELNGVKYKAIKIECDGVVYTFDNTNGRLLLGSMVLENGKWYYYWAGQPINDGWFEFEGNTYYAFSDGHLATGAVTIGNTPYMFTPQGIQVTDGVMIYALLSEGNRTMTVKVVNADKDMITTRLAIWAENAGQKATLQWFDMKKVDDTTWSVDVPMCPFGLDESDTFQLHVYGNLDGADGVVVNTTVNDLAPAEHTYADEYDYKCNHCGKERAVDMTRPMKDMYRMYDPNGHEHFYTGSIEERDMLVAAGWDYEGIGFTFPLTTGKPVYRLYDRNNTFEHLYTMDEAEKDALIAQGWIMEGIAFNSAFENEVPQFRLHNPNATRGAYHFTASTEERDTLIAAGWEYQGIGFYSMGV